MSNQSDTNDQGQLPELPAPAADENGATPDISAADAAAKRTRETWPIQILMVLDGGDLRRVPAAGTFPTRELAAKWILEKGDPGVTYTRGNMAPNGQRPLPRRVEDVTL
jgi:hypothetical protein